ncbi:hypothetical protein BC940DRAFT_288644 [Gongronella butleri]|nr:hypothetical protein BC940DRAFT_288644 [Gongronella butleri]
MDLNICLYCEKPIVNDRLSFCSKTCELNESAKSSGQAAQTAYGPLDASVRGSLWHAQAQQQAPCSPSSYEMSYHRRQSFSYTPTMMRRRPSGTSSMSSFDSLASALSVDYMRDAHSLPIDANLP